MAPSPTSITFNILAKDVDTTAAFYQALAGFKVVESDTWFTLLAAPQAQGFLLNVVDEVSEFAPRHAWGTVGGAYLTLEIEDVAAAVARARELGVEVVDEPKALEHGHVRALIRDPNGLIIDLSTPIERALGVSGRGFAPNHKNTAIDQQQAEENARHS